ncbi:MAG TPA: hypothetical protein VK465_12855 [Fibrobacteria bacterium]|nr:hypothetical protein [Fibrobacteria bacterium]
MEAPSKLKRMETFSAEIDSLPGAEYVSRILFESEASVQGDFAGSYLIAVHRIVDGKPALVHSLDFNHIYCTYMGKGGMTFAIQKSKVLFTHFKVESCGLTIDGHSRIDTLGFEDGAWDFREGAVQDRGEPLNRLDLAE